MLKSTILQEIYSARLINLPPAPMFQGSRVDRRKRCGYHIMFGHTIEECIGFRDLLEGLVRSGRLNQYIQRGPQHPPPPSRQEDKVSEQPSKSTQNSKQTMPIQGIINTIAGGFAGGGQTELARRKHLRAVQAVMSVGHVLPRRSTLTIPITFTDDDF